MSYNGRKNFLTGNLLSDEWYTPQFLVEKCIDIAKINEFSNKQVLCPFDTENSLFVNTIKKYNNNHLKYGMRDFLQNNYKFDVLITNPPFSLKEKVFEKCLQELDNTNEFILILPETFIFSVAFYNLLMKYKFNYNLYVPKQRVYYIDQNGNQNRPNFHTIIIQVNKSLKENKIQHFYSETK